MEKLWQKYEIKIFKKCIFQTLWLQNTSTYTICRENKLRVSPDFSRLHRHKITIATVLGFVQSDIKW